ncbi:hypothetical protein DAPPUDRAFT_328739 [Daphnia pulex]|uniref:Uncharacterized protein n=1 Tax=Daphnia pulex TaxID=6669 RepID=E9HEM2_DAPPU|nr:hypothetical protein DAPPUDRAFT_328739 [Daphnia pulex]|eukprot:EFX69780.1 hypothetical protein DAPPUDRAFT_328739 [Daphnia pulex]
MNCSRPKDVSHIIKFNGTNFPLWKLGLFVSLEEQEVLSIVDGTTRIPDEIHRLIPNENDPEAGVLELTNNAEIVAWKKKDVLARRILLSTINLQNTLLGCKTANEIWVRLTSQHLKNAAENKYVVMQRFYHYKFQAAEERHEPAEPSTLSVHPSKPSAQDEPTKNDLLPAISMTIDPVHTIKAGPPLFNHGNESNENNNIEERPTCANRPYPLRTRKPKVWISMKAAETSENFEPQTYQEAIQSKNRHSWKPAILDDYSGLSGSVEVFKPSRASKKSPLPTKLPNPSEGTIPERLLFNPNPLVCQLKASFYVPRLSYFPDLFKRRLSLFSELN